MQGLPAVVDDDVEIAPALKLPLPVSDGGEGGNHQEWAADASVLDHRGGGGGGRREGGGGRREREGGVEKQRERERERERW